MITVLISGLCIFTILLLIVKIYFIPDSELAKLRYEIKCQSLTLNENLQKPIYEKFKNGLMQIVFDEKICFHEYANIYRLNKIEENSDVVNFNKLAVGMYSYIPKEKRTYFMHDFPAISVLENGADQFKNDAYGNTFTLAHELGHHFMIQDHNDRSEEAADRYILELAKQILTKEEIYIISHAVSAHSRIDRDEFKKQYNFTEIFPFEDYKRKKINLLKD